MDTQQLEAGIADIATALPGTLGVEIRFVEDDVQVRYNADLVFPTASVIKVPIMVEAYRQMAAGILRPDQILSVDDHLVEGGSGVLQFLSRELRITVLDAIELMIIVSDNTATSLLLEEVGRENVTATMQSMGLVRTVSVRGGSQTTPHEMAELFARLVRREVVSEEASEAMLLTLDHQVFDDMIPRFLPLIDEPDRPVRLRVAHKTGSLNGVRNDVGIITCQTAEGERTIVVSAFTQDVRDGSLWTPENVAAVAVARIARLAYDTLGVGDSDA